MKKTTLLIALCVSLTSFAQSIGGLTKNGYEVNVTVATNPVKAYLVYNNNDGERIVDSVLVANNTFVFSGIAENPFLATLYLDYDLEGVFSQRRLIDTKLCYIEPGKITLTSADSINNASITGSVINDDDAKWSALSKELNDQLRANGTLHSSDEKQRELGTDFIKNNPDSWFALSRIYSTITRRIDTDAAQEILNLFSQHLKESKLGKERQAHLDALNATVIGAVAPLFTQNDPDGNPVNLSDFRGQWLLIDFWAAWCGPCRRENPHVVEAYNLYKDKGFTILGVSLDGDPNQRDPRADWLAAIEKDNLTWTQVSDLKFWSNSVAKQYAVRGIPANFLLNPEGVIVAKNLRGQELMDELAKHLD